MKSLLSIVLLAGLAGFVPAQDIATPEQHLGRPLGADFELADWNEVVGYYRALGEQSPRVSVSTVGTTTEGRDFLLATISSEENLARLDEIRDIAGRLADPRGLSESERGQLLEDGRVILMISIGMHSTETAAPQFGMELAHRLATSDEEPYASAREELVVVMAPCLNPDGLDRVVAWYRETVGTPHEGTSLLNLYQHYAGHDNNRDWFMQSLAETRIMTEQLYSVWHPQVYWDVHQQGSSRERFFVPPFRDPLNPNLDAGIIAGIDALGSRALLDMTRAGYSGVSSGVTYDMWWNGGNRNVPVRHNIIGLLTEAASVNIASPIFLRPDALSAPRGLGSYAPSNRFPEPWPGGWWRIRDIIDYEHAFAHSLLGSLSREPRVWLENGLEANERSIARGRSGAPRAWVLPATNPDTHAVRRLAEVLLRGGVELHVAAEPVTADGRTWPQGSLVIRRDQPYGDHVKDLFETQRYPEGDPPYDVAGWTLPLLMGVHRVASMDAVEGELKPVDTAEEAVAGLAGLGIASPFDTSDGDDWKAAIVRVGQGSSATFAGEGDETFDVERLPRIGIYAPWSGSMDEGWLRWVLDEWGLPYTRLRNENLRAGELSDLIDVLILPSVSARQLDQGRRPGTVSGAYAGGLDPEGAVAVDVFVRGGGRLITLGSSSGWAVDLFGLPLTDVTRGESAEDFSCPGSVVRTVPVKSPWTAGLPSSMAAFFSSSSAWKLDKQPESEPEFDVDVQVLLRYAPSRLLLSGWIREPQTIEGQAAWVTASVGAGDVHLFGFRPHYRSWAQGTFQLLFRALLLEPEE